MNSSQAIRMIKMAFENAPKTKMLVLAPQIYHGNLKVIHVLESLQRKEDAKL